MTQPRDIERTPRPLVQRRPGPGPRSRHRHRRRPDRTSVPAARVAPRLEAHPMNALAKVARRVAAAVLIVAVVGYNLLPGRVDRRRRARRRPLRPDRRRQPRRPRRPLAHRQAPLSGLVHAGEQAVEPGSCPPAVRRPGRSRPPSRTACRRAGSTAPTRPTSTGCSRTRPPIRPRSLAPENSPSPSIWGHITSRISSATRSRTIGGLRPRWSPPPLANEALAVSDVVDVAMGGLTGKQFDVRADPD